MKRLLSLLLAACLFISLTGCAIHIPPASDPLIDQPANNAPSDSQLEPDVPPVSDETTLPPDDSDVEQPPDEEDQPPVTDTELPPDESEPPDQDSEQDEEAEGYVRIIDPYAPMVALTFDDGPHEKYSQQILDVLEANHSVATFFEVGYNAVRYPEILLRMAELGCEIASHSYYHHDLTTLSQDAMLTDLAKLDKVIYQATGITPTLVRPPYGAVNSTVKYKTGRATILWTVDTKDWMYRDAQTLIEYLQNYGNLDGEIVLMHSIHGSTAEAMETVIPWLIEQGYQLVTVSELMAYYYGELLEANHYYNQNHFAKRERTEFPIELPDEPMETAIPAFTVVPVVPYTPPSESDTPPSTDPEVPPSDDSGTGETGTEPDTGGDAGSENGETGDTQVPEEEPVLPPESETGDEIPEGDDSNAADGEIPPEDNANDSSAEP